MVSVPNIANALLMAESSATSEISSSNASIDVPLITSAAMPNTDVPLIMFAPLIMSAPLITSAMPNSPQVVGIKLDGPNYMAWVLQFMPIFRTHEVMGIVDGSEPCPPEFVCDSITNSKSANPAYTMWQQKGPTCS